MHNSESYSHYLFSEQKSLFEKHAELQFLAEPLAFFKDRYLFNLKKANQEVEIYDVDWEKIVGKFSFTGEILSSHLQNNLLMIVSNNENLDNYLFFLLNDKEIN